MEEKLKNGETFHVKNQAGLEYKLFKNMVGFAIWNVKEHKFDYHNNCFESFQKRVFEITLCYFMTVGY